MKNTSNFSRPKKCVLLVRISVILLLNFSSFTSYFVSHKYKYLPKSHLLKFSQNIFTLLMIKAYQMHYFLNLFWYRTLHVSDRSTVHHQDSEHCIHSNKYLSY